MRAFFCELDPSGLRRFIPEEFAHEPAPLAPDRGPVVSLRALLDDDDAEALRADVHAGRGSEACGLLLNRALELTRL